APADQQPPVRMLAGLYDRLLHKPAVLKSGELKEAVINSIGSQDSPESHAALRKIADTDETRREAVIRVLARSPVALDWPYLLEGLASAHSLMADALSALQKLSVKPKAEEAVPYRVAIL